MNDLEIPDYAVHNDMEIKGFFGKYHFLSNFHPAPIVFEGITYPTSENCYQSQKVDKYFRHYFEDISPGKSKRKWKELGSIYSKKEWDSKKLDLMKIIVFIKFYKNLDLRKELLDTGNRYLEELNSWQDSFWGVNYKTGIGQNHLGKILMEIRDYWR